MKLSTTDGVRRCNLQEVVIRCRQVFHVATLAWRSSPAARQRKGVDHDDSARGECAPGDPILRTEHLATADLHRTRWLEPTIVDLHHFGLIGSECSAIDQQALDPNDDQHRAHCKKESSPHDNAPPQKFNRPTKPQPTICYRVFASIDLRRNPGGLTGHRRSDHLSWIAQLDRVRRAESLDDFRYPQNTRQWQNQNIEASN